MDLTPMGHQPLTSHNGRYVIVFNGEVYNHKDIRDELLKENNTIIWKGHSDTEIMLEAIKAWGVENALKRFTGMFAVALWDRDSLELTLARDRMGEKPLYYGWAGNTFLFGSELKALRACPATASWEIDRDVLCQYVRYNYVPAPFSIYKGIRKLSPGSFITIPLATAAGSFPEVRSIGMSWKLLSRA